MVQVKRNIHVFHGNKIAFGWLGKQERKEAQRDILRLKQESANLLSKSVQRKARQPVPTVYV